MNELAGRASIAPRKQNVVERLSAPGVSAINQSAPVTVAASDPLTPEQVSKFAAEGYLVIAEPQITQGEVAWTRDLIMQMLQSGKGRSEGRSFDLIASDSGKEASGTSPQLLKPSLYCPELGKFSFKQRGLLMAKQLIGPNARYVGDAVNYKPRQRGGATPWHQDEAFREPNLSYQEISIWIALTNVTLQSGPMGYVPYSHKLGILQHRLYGGAKEANSIECCDDFAKEKAVFCAIPAGAMIIHHCRTIHGAAVNHSDVDRLAYVLSYSTPLELTKDYRQFPWLVNLRTSLKNERKRTMMRGGALKELVRFVRSERFTPRYLLSIATFRGINRLRTLFKRD